MYLNGSGSEDDDDDDDEKKMRVRCVDMAYGRRCHLGYFLCRVRFLSHGEYFLTCGSLVYTLALLLLLFTLVMKIIFHYV